MSWHRLIPNIFLILTFLGACGLTKELWQGDYEEHIKQFLVSKDARNVVFLGEKYHYIFSDPLGSIDELLNLDGSHLILISTKNTKLEVDGKNNNIYGYLAFESFDLNLSPEQKEILDSLGFKWKKGDDKLTLKIYIEGKRYLGSESVNDFYLALNDSYHLEIHKKPTPMSDLEDIALTPLTVAVDTVRLSGDVAMRLLLP